MDYTTLTNLDKEDIKRHMRLQKVLKVLFIEIQHVFEENKQGEKLTIEALSAFI